MTQPYDDRGATPGSMTGRGNGPGDAGRVVVIGPDGTPLATGQDGEVVDGGESVDTGTALTDLVEEPAMVMRIGSMVKQLLEEVRSAPLDDASRARLREIHRSSITELERGLAPELVEELDRLTLPFPDDVVPSDAELRIAQAQLVGWLEGLFHGIQTALFAQQLAARAQFEEMRRRALPPGMGGGPGGPGDPDETGLQDDPRHTGNYL